MVNSMALILWRYLNYFVTQDATFLGRISFDRIYLTDSRSINSEVGNFHVNPSFHPTNVARNLGLTRKFPTSALFRSQPPTDGADLPE